MAYAPPPPPAPSLHVATYQNQEPHWQESEVANGVGGVSVNDEDSVGEKTQTSLNGHGQYGRGQTSGSHETESVSSPLDEIEGVRR